MNRDIDQCPTCGHETKMGFGLAGGGYGPYVYCEDCGIIEKWQEESEAPVSEVGKSND